MQVGWGYGMERDGVHHVVHVEVGMALAEADKTLVPDDVRAALRTRGRSAVRRCQNRRIVSDQLMTTGYEHPGGAVASGFPARLPTWRDSRTPLTSRSSTNPALSGQSRTCCRFRLVTRS